MGKSRSDKKKSSEKAESEKKLLKQEGIPSDQRQVVQVVLNYLHSLGLTSVCRKLESETGLKTVRASLYLIPRPGILSLPVLLPPSFSYSNDTQF